MCTASSSCLHHYTFSISTVSADADAEVLEEEEEEKPLLCPCSEEGMLAHDSQFSPHGAFLSVCVAACVGFSALSRSEYEPVVYLILV